MKPAAFRPSRREGEERESLMVTSGPTLVGCERRLAGEVPAERVRHPFVREGAAFGERLFERAGGKVEGAGKSGRVIEAAHAFQCVGTELPELGATRCAGWHDHRLQQGECGGGLARIQQQRGVDQVRAEEVTRLERKAAEARDRGLRLGCVTEHLGLLRELQQHRHGLGEAQACCVAEQGSFLTRELRPTA